MFQISNLDGTITTIDAKTFKTMLDNMSHETRDAMIAPFDFLIDELVYESEKSICLDASLQEVAAPYGKQFANTLSDQRDSLIGLAYHYGFFAGVIAARYGPFIKGCEVQHES